MTQKLGRNKWRQCLVALYHEELGNTSLEVATPRASNSVVAASHSATGGVAGACTGVCLLPPPKRDLQRDTRATSDLAVSHNVRTVNQQIIQ